MPWLHATLTLGAAIVAVAALIRQSSLARELTETQSRLSALEARMADYEGQAVTMED